MYTTLYYAILYYTILYYTTLHYTTLHYNTILYYTTLHTAHTKCRAAIVVVVLVSTQEEKHTMYKPLNCFITTVESQTVWSNTIANFV
jgi:hypothetical protein